MCIFVCWPIINQQSIIKYLFALPNLIILLSYFGTKDRECPACSIFFQQNMYCFPVSNMLHLKFLHQVENYSLNKFGWTKNKWYSRYSSLHKKIYLLRVKNVKYFEEFFCVNSFQPYVLISNATYWKLEKIHILLKKNLQLLDIKMGF